MKNVASLLFLICCHHPVYSQITVQLTTGEKIKTGQVVATHTEFDIGTINDLFDNDINSLARTPNINPAIITLEFEKPFRLSSSKLYMITDGKWTLESAMNLSDLDNHAGTYHQLFANNKIFNSVWDSNSFTPLDVKVVRLTAKRTSCCDGYVHINEWVLYATPQLTSLCIYPGAAKLLPGTSYTMQLLAMDAFNNEYIIPNNSATWNSSNPSIATVDNSGMVYGVQIGTTIISIQYNTLHYSLPALVLNNFSALPATKRVVKTALVIQDPVIAEAGDQRLHAIFGWNDPYLLAQQVADTLEAISHHTVEYEFTLVYDDNTLQTRMQGTLLSVDSMYHLLSEPGWTTLYANGTSIDYNLMLDTYDFCEKSNNGEIDEVWLMGFPYAGYYESELAGQHSFWYNSPPLDYGNNCVGLLPVMGYNFERDWPEAVHSYGHRIESTMSQVYGGWTYDGTPANTWELFASINIYNIGKSYVGNIHFPPNGESDYDYSNTTLVANFADNFNLFPYLFEIEKVIDCNEWSCDQGGYMRWWYKHLPHFEGKGTDGVLFNWWPYIIDYEEGLAQAGATSLCQCTKCHNTPHIVTNPVNISGTGLKEAGTIENYKEYFWSTGETNSTVNFSGANPPKLIAIDHDGCVYESSFSSPTAENENYSSSLDVSVTPTLTADKVHVTVTSGFSENIQIKILNSMGELMVERSSPITNNYLKEDFDVSLFPPGTYFLRISGESESKIYRLVVVAN